MNAWAVPGSHQGWANSLALSCALQACKSIDVSLDLQEFKFFYWFPLCHAVLHFLIFVSLVCCPWLAELYKRYIELYTAVRRLVSKERGLQHEQPCVGLGSLTKMTELVEWTSTFLSKTPDSCIMYKAFEAAEVWYALPKGIFPSSHGLSQLHMRSSFSGDTR